MYHSAVGLRRLHDVASLNPTACKPQPTLEIYRSPAVLIVTTAEAGRAWLSALNSLVLKMR